VSIYNLSGEEERQLSLDDLLENSARRKETELHALLEGLGQRYGLDFAGHLEQIYQTDTLHKTVEYMRKHV
jgi:DNA polymerase-4/DNA polymerase IV (DinB-like DNA polymerase)